MNDIRYWGSHPSASAASVRSTVRESLHSAGADFKNELMGELGLFASGAMPGGMGMFGSKGPQLMDMNLPGIEKVWAAQLSAPESAFMSAGDRGERQDGMSSGLAGMVELMVQEQIARARKHLQHQQQGSASLESMLSDVTSAAKPIEKTGASGDNPSTSLDAFINDIQQRIKQASGQFQLPEAVIRQRLWGESVTHHEETG